MSTERCPWQDPRPGDVVDAGPGYGMLVVTGVTRLNVLAYNPVRRMCGASGRCIPVGRWSLLRDAPGAEVHNLVGADS